MSAGGEEHVPLVIERVSAEPHVRFTGVCAARRLKKPKLDTPDWCALDTFCVVPLESICEQSVRIDRSTTSPSAHSGSTKQVRYAVCELLVVSV